MPHTYTNTQHQHTSHCLPGCCVVIEVIWQTLLLPWKMEKPVMFLLWKMEAHRLMKVNTALSHRETVWLPLFLSSLSLSLFISQDGWPVLPLCFEVTFLPTTNRGSFTSYPPLCCSHASTRHPLPWRFHAPLIVGIAVWQVKACLIDECCIQSHLFIWGISKWCAVVMGCLHTHHLSSFVSLSTLFFLGFS